MHYIKWTDPLGAARCNPLFLKFWPNNLLDTCWCLSYAGLTVLEALVKHSYYSEKKNILKNSRKISTYACKTTSFRFRKSLIVIGCQIYVSNKLLLTRCEDGTQNNEILFLDVIFAIDSSEIVRFDEKWTGKLISTIIYRNEKPKQKKLRLHQSTAF